ncbi:MAG: alanine--tRNA ligase, partial [Mycoplasma sp.]
DIENDRYIEIWNIVFSEFNNDGNNNYEPLSRKNIDTGAGLERIACISQEVPTNFDTDLFLPIINKIEEFSKFKYESKNYFSKDLEQKQVNRAFKLVADHVRSCVFAIADGAIPSNKERGYILRRLIRSMIVTLKYKLDVQDNIFGDLIMAVIDVMGSYYDYLKQHLNKITDVMNKEYLIFERTLSQGFKLLKESVIDNKIDGKSIFKLVETYGFPIELIVMLTTEWSVDIDLDKFNELFKEHQLISNARKNQIAMSAQNCELLELKTPFKFLYDVNNIEATITKLYDENFKSVDELNGEGYIVFDQSCFYATSGGQMNDIGYIDNCIFIDDVIKGPNLQYIHHTDNAIDLKIGSKHILSHDEFRRSLLSKNHSVEHLIHSALKENVDINIKQEGAFKSPDKVTFDFQYHEKLSDKKVQEIEDWINDVIKQSIQTEFLELSLEEAQAIGAMAYFEDVYKKITGKLRVIKMGEVSCELCAGTHVHNTDQIEKVKIINLSSKAAGSWRIEAITSNYTIDKYTNETIANIKLQINKIKELGIDDSKLDQLISNFNFDEDISLINKKFAELIEVFKISKMNFDKENNKKIITDVKSEFLKNNETISIRKFENIENKNLYNAISELINEHPKNIFVAFNVVDNKIQYMLATNEVNKNINLNIHIKKLNEITNGKGGGKPQFVQGGCSDYLDVDNLLKIITESLLNA